MADIPESKDSMNRAISHCEPQRWARERSTIRGSGKNGWRLVARVRMDERRSAFPDTGGRASGSGPPPRRSATPLRIPFRLCGCFAQRSPCKPVARSQFGISARKDQRAGTRSHRRRFLLRRTSPPRQGLAFANGIFVLGRWTTNRRIAARVTSRWDLNLTRAKSCDRNTSGPRNSKRAREAPGQLRRPRRAQARASEGARAVPAAAFSHPKRPRFSRATQRPAHGDPAPDGAH